MEPLKYLLYVLLTMSLVTVTVVGLVWYLCRSAARLLGPLLSDEVVKKWDESE